jgi:hypothetical protein
MGSGLILPYITWYPRVGFPPSGVPPTRSLLDGLDGTAVAAAVVAGAAVAAAVAAGLGRGWLHLLLLPASAVAVGLALLEGLRAGGRVAGWDAVGVPGHAARMFTPPITFDAGFYVFGIAALLFAAASLLTWLAARRE